MDGSTTSISVDPRQQLDDIVDFVNDSWLASTDFDGPTFLWNHMISDASAQDDDNRNNVPVAAPNEVADVIGLTMQWYFDSISSTVPTAERTEDGVSMPRNDMPTFRIDSQALSGVDAVVGNALMSTRWVDATTNLAKSVEMTARFVGNAADRDGEGFDGAFAHPFDDDGAGHQIPAELGEEHPFGGGPHLVPGASDALQTRSHRRGCLNLDDQIDGAHVDAELEAASQNVWKV